MNRTTISIAALAIAAAGGWYAYSQLGSSASSTDYANANIDIGATPASDTCGPTPGYTRMICLTDALTASLTPELAAKLNRPYTLTEAKLWSNFPNKGFADRVGPTLGDFTPDQRSLIKAILLDATSGTANEGYDEIEQVLNADDYLKAETADDAFASSNYHIAFLGTPGATGTWQLYFGGHHFALSNTYTDGVLTGATPSFRGVEPFTPFAQNGRDNAPMVQEQAAFAALFTALSADELAKATLATVYTNIVAGPQLDDAIPATAEGLRVGDLTPAQQALVLAAMETYVRDIAPDAISATMGRYTAELADTYIGLAGTATVDAENDYVRIDGPSVWIEFSLQPGRSLEGIHPHSVWRDKMADYGGTVE